MIGLERLDVLIFDVEETREFQRRSDEEEEEDGEDDLVPTILLMMTDF